MNYTSIENDIVARLAPLVTAGYEVEAMPDNEAANRPPRQRGRVTVQVGMSKFGEHRSTTAAVVQEEDIYVDIILRSRTLRAVGGIYDICELSRRLLIGFTPQNCRLPLSGVDFGGINPAELQDSIWTYSLRLRTQTISVGAADEDLTPLITAITFDDQTTIAPPPSAELFASAYEVSNAGDSVILAWITSGGDEVAISGIGVVDTIGSATVQVNGTQTYTLTLTQGANVITQDVTLSISLPDATFTLINTATPPATLDSGSIPSGGSDVIVAPAVTVLRDGLPFAVVPSSQTVDVPSDCPPCADATVELNGDEVATVASGGTVNIMVEQDGNPVGAFDPNSNSWVIPPCGASGDVTVTVSDATPSTGDTITITATATGFTPNNYLFFTYDGVTIEEIVEQASGVYSWLVDRVGTYGIYVLATDGTTSSYGTVEVVAASGYVLDQISTQPIWAVSLRRLRSAYTGPAATVRRSSDNATQNIGFIGEDLDTAALTAFVGVSNGFTATLYDQIAGVNPFQTTAGNQPRMVLSGTIDLLGGKPTIVFNGSSHQMPMPSSVSCDHGFLVARKASNTNLAQYVLGGTGQGLAFGGTFAATTRNINVISPGGNLISPVDNTLPHQVSFRMGVAGAGRLRVDGVTEATGTTSASMVVSRLGTRPEADLRHIGDFSEAILYPSVLSDADELVIENNQRSYYGL